MQNYIKIGLLCCLPLPPRLLCIAKAKSTKRIEELVAKEWERLLEEHSRIGWVHVRGNGVHVWARDKAIINRIFKGLPHAMQLTERSVFKARCGLRWGYCILASLQRSLLWSLLLLLLLQGHKLRVAKMIAAKVAVVDWQRGHIKWDMRRLGLLRCQRCRRRCSPDACHPLRG